MSEYKQIKTRIWQDNWFLSLSCEEKLLWIFLLTNEYCHISGLYEAPSALITPLTGIKNWENILKKFEKDKKIKLKDGWIYILNKLKHQPVSNSAKDNVNISIKKYFEENKDILSKITKEKKPLRSPLEAPCNTLPEDEDEDEDEIGKTSLPAPALFDSNAYIEEMTESDVRHIEVIGRYFRVKKCEFPSLKAVRAEIVRWVKTASTLKEYSNEDIGRTIEFILKDDYLKTLWTLETVAKKIINIKSL